MNVIHRIEPFEDRVRTSPGDNMLRALRHLQNCTLWRTVPELARELGMPHQVMYPIMRKLVRYGFAKAKADNGITRYLPEKRDG